MGATLVLLYVAEKEYWLAGVGDSRCYRYRRGGLAQLSSDHSVAFDVYKAGGITKEELRGHPDRNLLTRTLGSADFVAADIVRGPLEDDSRLLLCSDGLTKGLRDSEISGILAACADLPSACDKLLEQALARGVKDDITLILIDPGAEAALSEPRSDAPAHSEPSTAAPKAAPKHKWKALRGLRKTFKAAIGIPLPEAMPPDEALVPLLWPSEGGPEAAVIFGTPEASDRLCLTDNELDDCPEGYFFTGFWGYGYQSNAWYYARADAVSRIWLRLPYGNAYNSSDELAVEARAIREFLPRFFDFERKIREKAKFFRASQFHGGSYRLVTRDGREAFWRGDWPKGPDFEGVYRKLFGEGDGRG